MSDATTDSTTVYVYAPGIEARSRRLLISGLIFVGIGILDMILLLIPSPISALAVLTFWALPAGIGSFVTGLIGRRIGYRSFKGFFVSPMVWGATSVIVYSSIAGVTAYAFSTSMFTNNYPSGLVTFFIATAAVGVFISGVMAVVGFSRSGRRTIDSSALVEEELAPGGTRAFPVLALAGSLLFAPLGIIFGHLALRQIKRGQLPQRSRTISVVGLSLGYAFTAYWALVWGSSLISSLLLASH